MIIDDIITKCIYECLHDYFNGNSLLNPLPRTFQDGLDGLLLEPYCDLQID